MDMTNKAMASGLLLLLLLMNIGFALPVHGSEDDCWVDDRVDDAVCLKTERCRSICLQHSYANGRCQWGFPNLLPYCQCQRSNCHS